VEVSVEKRQAPDVLHTPEVHESAEAVPAPAEEAKSRH
jgi:hypothetical protein